MESGHKVKRNKKKRTFATVSTMAEDAKPDKGRRTVP